ncbi:MAG: PHP domain-containing protein, partial [bacterium]|nr:PHP domain-containing protein [bacterium]
IRGLIDWQYDLPNEGHRPITLVFATERSAAGIQEALQARRTVAWFDNLLVGREEYVLPLIESSLTVRQAAYIGDSSVLSVLIENTSDAEYILDNKSAYTFHGGADVVTLKPHQETRLNIKTLDRKTAASLPFEVLNAVTAPNTHPELVLRVSVD